MSSVATIRMGRERGGALFVYASAYFGGVRYRKKKRVPDDDEELGSEIVRVLRSQFALQDFSFFRDPERPTSPPIPGVGPSFREWSETWIESMRPPEIEESTWRNYRGHVTDLQRRMGDLTLDRIDQGVVQELRRQLQREGRAPRTVDSHLGTLRLLLLDARARDLVQKTAFDMPIRRSRTKRRRAAVRNRITFQPLVADEIEALLAALRTPRTTTERMYFPPTEALLLTGLRWGEVCALTWPDVSEVGSRMHILRALPKYARLDIDDLEDAPPPKTGETWSIPVRPPLAELLFRQRQRSYTRWPQGWVFPNGRGGHLSYPNWFNRGWHPLLEKSGVEFRVGNAQKALRRTWITSALICGLNPKQVAAHVGHTTTRMVNDVYDSFIDPTSWPEEEERKRLATIFGFDAEGVWARSGHARARKPDSALETKKPRRAKLPTGLRKPGARDRVRTGDIHVGNVPKDPEKPEDSS